MIDEGKLWSFLRSVLSQGGAIEMDFHDGKFKSYTEYTVHMDGRARDRVEQFIREFEPSTPAKGTDGL